MYNEFDQNITKESDPVRQKHYTTEKQAVGKKSCKIFVLAVWGKFNSGIVQANLWRGRFACFLLLISAEFHPPGGLAEKR